MYHLWRGYLWLPITSGPLRSLPLKFTLYLCLYMEPAEAIAFIEKAISGSETQNWADLGCGSGTFTKALIALLPPGSHITAIDRVNQLLKLPQVDFIQADIERDKLSLEGLNGILIANAMHYISDKAALIKKLEPMFGSAPRFVIIEYETSSPNTWVPFPVTFEKLQALFTGLGYNQIVKLNERPSVYRSGQMYCALVER
jgi:ubiquinone/menaquinone biosynthesis C-methylase UbiE